MSLQQFFTGNRPNNSAFDTDKIDGLKAKALSGGALGYCSKLPTVIGVSVILSSCASLTPVGHTPDLDGNGPAYPMGYGVPVTERTLPQRLLDRSIEHTASVNIKALDPNLANNSRLSIDSFYSEVLLTGEVPDEQTKNQIVAIVRSMPDVRQVYDELKVAANRGYSSTIQDGYITSKMMAKILANHDVKSSQVKIVTDNGVVYVMGRMTPTQQSHIVDIANQTVGITELVLLTTLVDDRGIVISQQDVMQESNLEAPSEGGAPRRSIKVNQDVAPAASSLNNNAEAQATTPPVQYAPANSGDGRGGESAYIDLYQNQVGN